LSNIVAYPSEVKERIYTDSYKRLSFMPTLTAKQIPNGILKDYWMTWIISGNSGIRS